MGATSTTNNVWSRDQIAARILNGDTLIIYKGQLLVIPEKWLDSHPGGSLALLHFVGRDASDEIEANHSDTALQLVSRFSVGRVELAGGVWLPLVPPISTGWVRKPGVEGKREWFREAINAGVEGKKGISSSFSSLLVGNDSICEDESASKISGPTAETLRLPPSKLSLKGQAKHSKAYRELHQRIVSEGLYETRYIAGYGPELIRYLFFISVAVYAYHHEWFITSATFLGFLWHQLSFTVHDLGHMGVTHNWLADRLIATFLTNFMGGLSIGWWVHNHNVHHLVTNHPNHDPDIEYVPFFAITPAFLNSLWSTYYKRVLKFDAFARFVLSIQHKLFYLILMFARFNLYFNSYVFLFQKAFDTKRARGGNWAWRLEILGILTYWTWYSAVLRGCGSWKMGLVYMIINHVVPSPLHVQLVLSHFSMSTEDLGPMESFPHRQLRTTTDVVCSDNVAFLHGGLHLQVTHHLFPRLPRHNLRAASKLVKQFAKDQGLTYAEFGFVEGNREVVGTLRNVAEQVKIIGSVASQEVKGAQNAKNAAVGLNIKA